MNPYSFKKKLHRRGFYLSGFIPIYTKEFRYYVYYDDTELFWVGSFELADFVVRKMNIAYRVGCIDSRSEKL